MGKRTQAPFLLTALGQKSTWSGRIRCIIWEGSGAGADTMEITDNPDLVPPGEAVAVLHIGRGGSGNYNWHTPYPGPGLHAPYGLMLSRLVSGRVLIVPADS